MRWQVALGVVALVLAGCSGPEEAAAPEEEDFEEFELEETQEELGVIRGVVVDAAIQPLEGAVVSVDGTNVTTKESGAFAFKDLEPGRYVVQVAKAGYKDTQTGTQVEADVKEPPVLRIMLERMPGTEPRIVPDSFQGIITCSTRAPSIGFTDGCVVFGGLGLGSTQRTNIGFPAGSIWWVQTELTWDPVALTAERLCLDQGESLFEEEACTQSPIVQGMDRETVEGRGLHKEDTVRTVVYPDHLLADTSGNLVVDQDFEIFSHAFYNFLPPEGWEFGRDGLPPVPA